MNAEAMFRESGAVLNGHFLLHSGNHSPVYWEKFKEILVEDRGILEKKMFRPGFISGYYERVSSGRKDDSSKDIKTDHI